MSKEYDHIKESHAAQALADALAMTRLELQAARREIVELTGAREDLVRELIEARGQIEDKKDALYSAQREAAQLTRRVEDARAESAKLEALLNLKQHDMTCAKTEALGLHQKVEILRRELDAERSAMGELERRHATELRFERSARVGLNATIDGCQADRESTRAHSAKVQAEAARLEAERYTACEERDAARTEAAEAMTRAEKAEAMLAEAEGERLAALAKVAKVRAERDAANRALFTFFPRADQPVRIKGLRPQPPEDVLQRYIDARKSSGMGKVLRGADHFRPLVYVTLAGDTEPGIYFVDELEFAAPQPWWSRGSAVDYAALEQANTARDSARTECAEALTRAEKAEALLAEFGAARTAASAALSKAVEAVLRHERSGGRGCLLTDVLDGIGRAQLAIGPDTHEAAVLRGLVAAKDAALAEGAAEAPPTTSRIAARVALGGWTLGGTL